jgi:hypothetical protein
MRRDPGRDRHGPVDSGRDDPVDLLCAGELAYRGLVLDGYHRPPVDVLEADRRRVAVTRDDVEAALARRAVQPELRRPGAQD